MQVHILIGLKSYIFMKTKKNFSAPFVSVVEFNCQNDIIATSNGPVSDDVPMSKAPDLDAF